MIKSIFKKYWPQILFAFSLAAYLILANILRSGPDFSDETEKLVGVTLIADGMKLYKDIFAHHGPFAYMVAHLFYVLTGSQNIETYRFVVITFSFCSIAAIVYTPAIKKVNFRLVAASLFIICLILLQTIYGLMLNLYQVYAGHLLVCIIALLIIPAITGNKIPRSYAFISGLCLGFIFFCAYSFLLVCGFLVLICIISNFTKSENQANNRISFYNTILGILVAATLVITYLYFFGDIKGYAVYHLYFNQVIYSKYIGFNLLKATYLIIPIFGYYKIHFIDVPWNPTPQLTFFLSGSISFAVGILCLWLRKKSKVKSRNITCFLYFITLLFGIAYSNPRGADDFQLNTFAIVLSAFYPFVTCYILSYNTSWKKPFPIAAITGMAAILIALILAQFLTRTYLYETSSRRYYKLSGNTNKSKSKEFELLRSIVSPSEKVQQFPYDLNFYTLIDRKPATGNYYYLPWQNEYFQKPILGYKIDVCSDIKTQIPKIIYYRKSVIWIYETSSYLGCVEKLLKEKYLRTSIMNSVWIRADIVASRDDLIETAIIHDGADFNWIDDPKLRDSLKKIPKLNYKALSISKGNICLHKMEGGNRNISSGDCEDKNVLKVRLRTKGQISEMVTLPNMECVEVDGNSTEEDKNLRIWPCQNTLNQNFRILPSESGFHLRAENSNLCLNLSNKLLVQTNCEKAIEWKFKDVLKSDEDIF